MADSIFPSAEFSAHARISSMEQYREMYQRSLDDPEGFWGEQADRLTWTKRWQRAARWDFHTAEIAFFEGGELNVSANCLDRHLATRGAQTALIWEGDDPAHDRHITYRELHEQVCRFANVLKANGVKKGDRVTIYLPMIPELAVAMLACARIGAVHSVIFAGFSPNSIRDRVEDCKSDVVITADEGLRGGKVIPLKQNVDEAIAPLAHVRRVIVVRHTGLKGTAFDATRDRWWHDEMANAAADCPAEPMGAEDPLFILYTSGSTGKPKGVLHTSAGYLLYAALTHELVFDYKDGEVFWCTADIGWITGHSYIVYGPLANGATSVMFEGVPNYPDWSRFWQVCDKHRVAQFYTAPTALRAIARHGDDFVTATSRKSIRVLGTVGEPINPEVWKWYYDVVGEGRCPIVDTWWQTETGGHLITSLPGCTPMKPGSATLPFFGVEPVVVDSDGRELTGACEGPLCLRRAWPGMMRTVFGDHDRFRQTYFSTFKGLYFTGDGCRRDADGYYWITGRIDDVLNVSGHRMGTAEVESALVSHAAVAEAAVVGFPHEVKGQGIYAYVTLNQGIEPSEVLRAELVAHVRKEIGAIAAPDVIHWAPALPKTRSGKIMRRILRKVAEGMPDQIGDTTTLADPSVVDDIIKNAPKR
ncbi:MAG: acetate--CoA ligase [Nitrospirae bacterium CG_4_8_14_3_um_filter_70_85]|nr:MAG: acetate--CoA ligase [Nitrospirae bacterium CG06_land_8_20_14_3_00_70_43]PIW81814.1 MAG: acetate--CoA ligase [Nitrospirae bacterium CG_4_8_14_3_um_filter_70_85]PJB96344.1 MAG: acetate--CoA ligase [Nitrospirae bacterium CG_4_9_14_0_8_um_filter_70_14]HBB40981.1 acetate--CoA ligase [Pseudomonadota bacterium]